MVTETCHVCQTVGINQSHFIILLLIQDFFSAGCTSAGGKADHVKCRSPCESGIFGAISPYIENYDESLLL